MIKKILIPIFLLLTLFLVLIFINNYYLSGKLLNGKKQDNKEENYDSQKPITILMVGDMMFDRGVERSVNQNFDGNFLKIFENVPQLKEADITFGNLEGPITESKNKKGSIYSFKFNPIIANVLKEVGFDVVSFANNHVGDYGQEGFVDTLNYLNSNNILFAGAGFNKTDASTAKILKVKGKKIGFLAFTDVGPNWMKATEKSPGILLANDLDFEKIISTQKERVDYLVVSFHWGEEYKGVNKRQRELATLSTRSGADIIVGHHPHVAQDDIFIKDKLVLFSLGNFIFDQRTPKQTKVGMVAVVTIDINGAISIDRFASDRDQYFRPSSIRELEKDDIVL